MRFQVAIYRVLKENQYKLIKYFDFVKKYVYNVKWRKSV